MVRKYKISVNGKEYDVEVREVAEEQIEAVKSAEKKPEPIFTSVPVISVPIEQKKSESVESSFDGPDGIYKITAPMPGTIMKINFEKGQNVKRGEVVLILEAMKMENEITAPMDGILTSLNVSTGSKVSSGDTMFTM
ncbi:MAG: biotin/lipoyl-containing protein [Ignavibacteriales bacterium]